MPSMRLIIKSTDLMWKQRLSRLISTCWWKLLKHSRLIRRVVLIRIHRVWVLASQTITLLSESQSLSTSTYLLNMNRILLQNLVLTTVWSGTSNVQAIFSRKYKPNTSINAIRNSRSLTINLKIKGQRWGMKRM